MNRIKCIVFLIIVLSAPCNYGMEEQAVLIPKDDIGYNEQTFIIKVSDKESVTITKLDNLDTSNKILATHLSSQKKLCKSIGSVLSLCALTICVGGVFSFLGYWYGGFN